MFVMVVDVANNSIYFEQILILLAIIFKRYVFRFKVGIDIILHFFFGIFSHIVIRASIMPKNYTVTKEGLRNTFT